jgi:hypothetical protein
MKIVIAPKYESASASHLIATQFDQIHSELKREKDSDILFVPQPIQEQLPYLADDYIELLEKINGGADTLVIIGRPSMVMHYAQYGRPKNVWLWCPPVLQADYSDYAGLSKLVEMGNSGTEMRLFAFDRITADWITRYTDKPVETIKLSLPEVNWSRSRRQKHEGLNVLNNTPASVTKMIALGLQGVTILVQPNMVEAAGRVVPLYKDREVTKFRQYDSVDEADCFVIDKTLTVEQMLEFFGHGLYPVIGSQFEEGLFYELERILSVPADLRPLISVRRLSEQVPLEAESDLEQISKRIAEYNEAEGKTLRSVVEELCK